MFGRWSTIAGGGVRGGHSSASRLWESACVALAATASPSYVGYTTISSDMSAMGPFSAAWAPRARMDGWMDGWTEAWKRERGGGGISVLGVRDNAVKNDWQTGQRRHPTLAFTQPHLSSTLTLTLWVWWQLCAPFTQCAEPGRHVIPVNESHSLRFVKSAFCGWAHYVQILHFQRIM